MSNSLICFLCFSAMVSAGDQTSKVDFNRDIRPILSNTCFHCHGPDEDNRQAGLRLDTTESITARLDSDAIAVVAGFPEKSELIHRVTSNDPDLLMPPSESGRRLSPQEVDLLKRWVQQGAQFDKHWSYRQPVRPRVPRDKVIKAFSAAGTGSRQSIDWPENDIDYFVLDRLIQQKLRPNEEADRYALIRRVALDLTGLPPSLDEVDRFVNDNDENAYEKLVDRLLEKSSYGEHWARKWLDLARYADSAGYADDPERTIWAYRDWVIRTLNANKPFDEFTIEQLAGDLLPNPTDDQLIATAFHRNTLTNNEGGTNNEEFRNVAIVDRVNTTMAVWMGTTMNCCQCHTHKYDPLTQSEYFQLFAIFNNTSDADLRDESPLLDVWTDQQKQQKATWQAEIAALKQQITTPTSATIESQQRWEERMSHELSWQVLKPDAVTLRSNGTAVISKEGQIHVTQPQKTDVYSIDLSLPPNANKTMDLLRLAGIRFDTLPHDDLPGRGPGHANGNFVVTHVQASIVPPGGQKLDGRYIRIENIGPAKILSLAEVQVFRGTENIATKGTARQSSLGYEGYAKLAIDGITDGDFQKRSTTHTQTEDNPWWELDLKSNQTVDRLEIWNRTDNGLHTRLKDFRIALLDENREVVWESTVAESPNPHSSYDVSSVRNVKFMAAYSDFAQEGFAAANVLNDKDPDKTGWAIAPQFGKTHSLTLISADPVEIPNGDILKVTIDQLSKHENHTIGHFRIAITEDERASEHAKTPESIRAILTTPKSKRSDAQKDTIAEYYLTIAPEFKEQRLKLTQLQKQLAEIKPHTTVPVMSELAEDKRRTTHIQLRGNYLAKGAEVTAGVPAAFHPLPEDEIVDRLALARWLIDEKNPLTARVIANRYWEALFGQGIVKTSEEFGSQGDLPSHPELLDWLATELIRLDWDMKAFLKVLVTSATYRQSSKVTPEVYAIDPANILMARGPRFRLSAEMIRDSALAVSGLLETKMFGMPVKPPQPTLGLRAAFGSETDWKTSTGPDRFRRGIYTSWRRSNPYPSMATFDAPSREVCTVRRDRTNTPLQALVTLNDPVYVEAAQALARRMNTGASTTSEKVHLGFRLCLARPPSSAELEELVALYEKAHERFMKQTDQARQLATNPLGPLPAEADAIELGAWTAVANVLLNLDEMLMKR